MFDLFISYAHQDKAGVTTLAGRLRKTGISVWVDEDNIPAFAGITRSIEEGLGQSKALLAYYSKTYPTRRPCQWELTFAFLKGQSAGDPRDRVLVVNPEISADHIHPIELQDALFRGPDDPDLPARLYDHLKRLTDPLGAVAGPAETQWFGHPGPGPRRFIGRLPELWRVHSLLAARFVPIITHKSGLALAQIAGLGGIGKSMLAEEYGARFAAAYPGGIFWMRAYGHDDAGDATDPNRQEAERRRQFVATAALLGLSTKGKSIEEVEGNIAEALHSRGRVLWIVDDVPPGLTNSELQKWFAPDAAACNLITTRSTEYEQLGGLLDLGTLEPDDANNLLCSFREPANETERSAAAQICSDLGRQALALAVIGSRLAAAAADKPFAAVHEELQRQDEDALELAARFTGLLPTGHETSIAATLLRSIRMLGPEGLDLLRLASVLAAAPIPLRLIRDSFAKAGPPGIGDAETRLELGVHQTGRLSLSERNEDYLSVHSLVSRVIRFQDPGKERSEELRRAAVDALVEKLPGSTGDWNVHPEIEFDVVHARQLLPAAGSESPYLLNCLGNYDYERGAYDSAERLLRQCILELGDSSERQKLNQTKARLALAEVLRERGDVAAAVKLQEEALDELRRKLGRRHKDTLVAMTQAGKGRFALGDVRGAIKLLEEAAEGLMQVAGVDDAHTLTAIGELAVSYFTSGDYQSALPMQIKNVELCAKVLGSEHRDTLTAMNSLAVTKRALGDFDGALTLQRKATEALRRLAGIRHYATLGATNQLAYTLYLAGHLDEAEQWFREVYETRKQMFGEAHADTLNSANGLASVLAGKGNTKDAARLLENAIRAAPRKTKQELLTISVMQTTLAQAYELMNQRQRGVALLEESVPVIAEGLGVQHPNTTTAATALMTLYGNSGNLRWRTIFDTYLSWIMEADPDTLSADQRQLRKEWAQVLPQKTRVGLLRRLFGRR